MKELENIKFNLTQDMVLELIKFNNIRKKLYNKKELYNLNKNDALLLEIDKLEKKLEILRNNFIVKFRKNNKSEILEYLKYKEKDQN